VTSVPALPARAHRWGPLALLLATIAAAAAGVGIATVLFPPAGNAPPPASTGAEVLSNGIASLSLPEGWERLRRSGVPGLERTPGARALSSDVAIDTRVPDEPSLLPGSVLRALGVEAPEPELIRSGPNLAWAYRLPGLQDSTRITALVLPTTLGVVSIVCVADKVLSPFEAADCEAALAALELARGAAPLRPVPELAVRLTAGPAIARLDKERSVARRALASARSPVRREALASRIAAAYATAAQRLGPLARGAARPLPRALGELARKHRALARASARRDAPSARRAGRAIDRGERALAAQLAAVSS